MTINGRISREKTGKKEKNQGKTEWKVEEKNVEKSRKRAKTNGEMQIIGENLEKRQQGKTTDKIK